MPELLRGYAVTTLCGWSVFPLLHRILARLPDRGYALSRCFGVVLAAWTAWIAAGAAGRALTTPMALAAVLAAGGICWTLAALCRPAGAAAASSPDDRLGAFLLRRIRWIVCVEVLFLLGLALFAWIEGHNPAVDPDSERFMDYAMLRASLRSPGLPVADPWFAGADLAYYHFGYAVAAFLVRCGGADPARFFTALVALQHALLWIGAFGIGLALTGRGRGGFVAAFFVLGAGNLEWARQWARAGGIAPLDWFASSRVIGDTISEFPWFSLLWGDLHPYVIALPIVACALAFALAGALPEGGGDPARVGLARAACFALLCGALLATHPWDLPIVALAAPILVAAGPGRRRVARGAAWVMSAAASWLLFMPFLKGLAPGTRGIGRVAHASPPGAWVMAFGPFALLAALAAAVLLSGAGRRPGRARAIAVHDRLALVLAGLGALTALACETVYVRDLFEATPLYRMNTVFKLHRLAWLLLGLASPCLIERLVGSGTRARRAAGWGAVGVTLAAALVYPVCGTRAWLQSRAFEVSRQEDAPARAALSPGADAEAAFRALHPGDAAAASFIARAQAPGEAILEETGEPYTWSSRISTFSGVPAVLGWGNHQAVWRQDWGAVLKRREDVAAIYRSLGSAGACGLMESYGVRWVVVGERERQRYAEGLSGFAAPALPAFEKAGTAVYDVRGLCGPAPQRRAVLP
jgi:uncharacterized membrane protein